MLITHILPPILPIPHSRCFSKQNITKVSHIFEQLQMRFLDEEEENPTPPLYETNTSTQKLREREIEVIPTSFLTTVATNVVMILICVILPFQEIILLKESCPDLHIKWGPSPIHDNYLNFFSKNLSVLSLSASR
ncbi:hypothetical protein CDAR_433151 [Caerostris darwini]|uniref:Uncharacterized protein n=1 Tax=Caerostris darwini TaxID=1538125 RepID=A0AAV4QGR4_9ARAC|nr:hypothetical protein CDAR_433151 [Caerostris darwini]